MGLDLQEGLGEGEVEEKGEKEIYSVTLLFGVAIARRDRKLHFGSAF